MDMRALRRIGVMRGRFLHDFHFKTTGKVFGG